MTRYLAEYEERNRESSTEVMRSRLARFRRDFAGRGGSGAGAGSGDDTVEAQCALSGLADHG